MKKTLLVIASILIVAGGGIAIWAYSEVYAPKQLWSGPESHKYIYVPSDADYDDWKAIVQDSLPGIQSFWFEVVSERMNLESHIYPGRYKIERNISLIELNKKFRSAQQDPLRLVIPVKWRAEEIAALVSQSIEADSSEIMRSLLQLKNNGVSGNVDECFFLIPNTYELYWNTAGKTFAHRMQKESQAFWERDNRKEKANSLGLSPEEVYTLASIVYRETSVAEEMPQIAGVYLNRLEKGIALQADPTVKFAVQDLGLRRILNRHLKIESPYNTYKYPGLPPGPISMASIQSIDAVLNANEHEYLYFCAKPDSSGRHNFSKTYNAHLVNAQKFHNWLNKRNIR
jgi:UPF0755 protein